MSKLSLEWFKETTEKAIEKVVATKFKKIMDEEETENDSPEDEILVLSMKLQNLFMRLILLLLQKKLQMKKKKEKKKQEKLKYYNRV